MLSRVIFEPECLTARSRKKANSSSAKPVGTVGDIGASGGDALLPGMGNPRAASLAISECSNS